MKAEYLNISDITVPALLNTSTPSEKKIKKMMDIYQTTGEVSVISVCNLEDKIIIIDGYIAYLVAVMNDIKSVKCIVYSQDEVSDDYLCQSKLLKTVDFRKKIHDKYNGRCYICGRNVYELNDPKCGKNNIYTIDHIVPSSKGGKTNMENLACCCNLCNSLKSSFTYSDELKHVILNELNQRGIDTFKN